MKAIILNATAWMIVPVMDAFAKYLSSSMDVLQITWSRYFFTVIFTLSLMLIFYRHTLVWTKKPTFSPKKIGEKAVTIKGATKANVNAFAKEITEIA